VDANPKFWEPRLGSEVPSLLPQAGGHIDQLMCRNNTERRQKAGLSDCLAGHCHMGTEQGQNLTGAWWSGKAQMGGWL
jgi:hypothetical protein